MPNIVQKSTVSFEYIRGLIDGEGCFTFCNVGSAGSKKNKKRIPAFIFSMSKRDKDLLFKIKEKLKLSNKIYEYPARKTKDGYVRSPMTMIIIRDLGQLKNTIIPLCYEKLVGYKSKQFHDWINKIGSDPMVPTSYKLVSRLFSSGFYDNDKRFVD